VWRRRTNRRPCCPPMSNLSTSSWTARPDGAGNRMAAQHLPRDLVRPSSGLKNWLKRRRMRSLKVSITVKSRREVKDETKDSHQQQGVSRAAFFHMNCKEVESFKSFSMWIITTPEDKSFIIHINSLRLNRFHSQKCQPAHDVLSISKSAEILIVCNACCG